MIFSAVALVAFSFAGMANEIEDKKLIDETELVNCDHCYAYADSLDDGSDRTNQTWMRNVDACRTSNGCEAEFAGLIKKKSITAV
ncbi:hypothetical protein [Flavobacterium tibetense]|uniref:Uncharacterized protein n=1 Tax=Flavobacterium tibetense TaxID=2233533 RepID=A0A365P4X6_9FLAO|nr:hypothetical protein [Flavobacterium tibetense]RBA29650.1 hypothetical protein DPN68_00005 [Flavobacterium tibetense]